MNDEPPISSDLLAAVARGEDAAWEEFVALLQPQIHAIIRRQVRDTRDHEDIAQEVLTKIFVKLGQFAGGDDLRHWVSRIAINTCYDWLRRRKVRPLSTYADLGEERARIIEETAAREEPAENLDHALLLETLHSLIDTLKPREQIVIRLLDLEELSVQDVCERTGWGASKVKVTAMRARRKLASLLEKHDPNRRR
jgi:RNA polymerase sigma-70 factor (ECF subfamily)